jgi:hypothetical protein
MSVIVPFVSQLEKGGSLLREPAIVVRGRKSRRFYALASLHGMGRSSVSNKGALNFCLVRSKNILLSREVRRGKPQNALAMYSTFKGMDFMLPDAQTFGSLFALYRRIRPRVMRKLILTPESTHLIPLRQLYSEFVDAAQHVNHPMVMTTSVLNTTVRAFLRQRDYAGLVVVLNSFDVHRIPLDHHTYYSIMKHLIGRIWIEVTSKRLMSQLQVKWCDRFLGVHFNEIKLSEDLVQHILFLVSRTQLEDPLHLLEEPSKKYDDKGRYKMPTMEMMQSVDTPDPQDFNDSSVVPSSRICRTTTPPMSPSVLPLPCPTLNET